MQINKLKETERLRIFKIFSYKNIQDENNVKLLLKTFSALFGISES